MSPNAALLLMNLFKHDDQLPVLDQNRNAAIQLCESGLAEALTTDEKGKPSDILITEKGYMHARCMCSLALPRLVLVNALGETLDGGTLVPAEES